MSRLIVCLLIFSTGLLSAEDNSLSLMRSQLLRMRSSQTFNMKARGATPALTTVKHELIAWIESRLVVLPPLSDARALQSQLNDELKSAGLFGGTTAKIKCDQQNPLGSLDKIVLDRQGSDLLVVRTSVGVQVCGVDESAYAYAWQEGRWQRFWDSEQDDYRENKYFPQRFDQVLVSDSAPDHLIVTLGHNPWCTSVWQPVYYRVWHTHPGVAPPKLLLDGTDDSFIDEFTGARVSGDDVLFEYAVSGIPAGDRLAEIRHYLFREGKLERVNPVALTPRDFVAFWLVRPWSETAAWTEKSSRVKLQAWRQQHQEGGNWFDDRSALQCKAHPDVWQVSLPHSPNPIYALIRWLPPHRFTMVDIGDHPWPDCTMADPDADQPLYLFPYR